MKPQPLLRNPASRQLAIMWHRLYIGMAKQSRSNGWGREAASFLNKAAIERTCVQYFMPNGKEPF